jgi:H+-transporting ATPase
MWRRIPATELVPGDVLKLSLDRVVRADARFVESDVLLDQSMLIGESRPIEAGAGHDGYAGALVQRG